MSLPCQVATLEEVGKIIYSTLEELMATIGCFLESLVIGSKQSMNVKPIIEQFFCHISYVVYINEASYVGVGFKKVEDSIVLSVFNVLNYPFGY